METQTHINGEHWYETGEKIEFTKDFQVTEQFLKDNKNICFVYGDNRVHKGRGGAAKLRYSKNSLGFVTKKYPDLQDISYFLPEEYLPVYYVEIIKLKEFIKQNPQYDKILISKIGGGLANKYGIFESIIEPRIKKDLSEFGNRIVYLF